MAHPYNTISSPNLASGASYTYSNSTNTWATVSASTDLTPNSLQVKGKSEFEDDVNIIGDLKLQGKSLKDSLDRIEERLAILRPNEELEEKWDNLRGLRKMYMELEAEIIEKEKVWNILRK